ncbi:CDP-alcohol phosphatidyltransferase family protein [Brachybacterium fresconis]
MLALLATGQLLGGGLVVALVGPTVGVAALSLVLGMSPTIVAAATLRPRTPGPVTGADLLSMLRLLAAGVLAAMTVLALTAQMPSRSWFFAVLAGAALASDALDGRVARRTGTAGPIGARIDMEADAALVLVLSVLAATTVGPWVLVIGAMRYIYVAASWGRPALRRPLVHSDLRRGIGALQGIALMTAVVPALPEEIAMITCALALGLLVWSFGRDVIRQEREERPPLTRRRSPP